MPLIAYLHQNFSASSRKVIQQANEIIDQYRKQGFILTLRQLYYQFVSRDYLPNTVQSYKRLGEIINNGRLAGKIDWNAIEDRTRNLVSQPHWGTVSDILEACAASFAVDKWEGQRWRPEVWIEKEALSGVIAGICRELDIPYFACRGYTSQSEMWGSAMRYRDIYRDGGEPVIIHLGDHDPSGMDMTRDILDRMELFLRYHGHLDPNERVRRIALNMDQIRQYNPPPNPAKVTDSRFNKYMEEYGDESWELDALEPRVIVDLIRETVLDLRNEDQWDERVAFEEEGRERLKKLARIERRGSGE